jgi:hypothetical protein
MTAEQVRAKRAEAEARLRSCQKAYESALGEHRDFIRELRDNCPHENKQTEAAQYVHECVCEDCGAVLTVV